MYTLWSHLFKFFLITSCGYIIYVSKIQVKPISIHFVDKVEFRWPVHDLL